MNESNIFGVSVRGLLVFMLTLSVCVITMYMVWHFKIADRIPEPLYSGFMLGLGFYFGQKTSQGGTNGKETSVGAGSDANGKPSQG